MLFIIDRNADTSAQNQLREQIIAAILNGQLPAGTKMPSTRKLAKNLSLSRTTVVLVYEKLVENDFLIALNRSGFMVSDAAVSHLPMAVKLSPVRTSIDWKARTDALLSHQRNIVKPANWQDFPYPFVYGQPDASLFPLPAWRECSRQAMSQSAMRDWASDAVTADDPELIEEIRTKLLPKRGIYAGAEEILITMGAQNGLYLIASALMKGGVRVGIENPGYPDARNIFEFCGAALLPLEIDGEGVVVGDALKSAQMVYVTPSHQYPTTVTLSEERRAKLLDAASSRDLLVIEDDFESDTNYTGESVPALKSQDGEGRVIYVGSLSKSMFPGLRLGYIVASAGLIRELRALRRLIVRHAPSNNQRTTALFIAQGYHDAYIRKLHNAYGERWEKMRAGLDNHLPGMTTVPSFGGTSFWIRGPEELDAELLATRALKEGVVLEPGAVHFMQAEEGRRFFRLGFSSIATNRIDEGITRLARLLDLR